jgi:hypothetical protein
MKGTSGVGQGRSDFWIGLKTMTRKTTLSLVRNDTNVPFITGAVRGGRYPASFSGGVRQPAHGPGGLASALTQTYWVK